jgi:hypothetical protein
VRRPEGDAQQASPAEAAALAANVENFFSSLAEPQRGHFVPFQRLERTSTSLSSPQPSQ